MFLVDIIFSIIQVMLILFIALLIFSAIYDKVSSNRNQTYFPYLDEYKRNMKK